MKFFKFNFHFLIRPSIAGHTDGPFFCDKSLPFNPRKIDWLLGRLEEYWPNLYTDTPLESFWYT